MASSRSVPNRTPVVVGVGQFIQRPEDPAEALEPVAMMTEAVERAADDAGTRRLAARADAIWVVRGAWPYRDPGRIIASRVGASPRHTALSADGGNTPQSLVNRASLAIRNGELDVVVLAGAEGIYSRRRARRAGQRIPYTDDSATAPADELDPSFDMGSDLERERGVEAPINVYPIFENAIRASRGEAIEDHRSRIAQLWEGFNRVAVGNPYAWLRRPLTAEQIRTPSADNRMVGFPYTKSMNSNWDLDQAAAVILCAAEVASELGIQRDRWVFPYCGTDAHDTYLVSNRPNLHSSPAIHVSGRHLFEMVGMGVDDMAHVDLYSCFPSAVQIAATELGLGQDRQLTVTGGLSFAGGPLNNYVMHSIATMCSVLRAHPGDRGLVTANGGFVTKHALGIYSTEPPAGPFQHRNVQDEVDRAPTREVVADHVGAATIESYTVMHGADGPEVALVAALAPDGRRTWARSDEADLVAALLDGTEPIGRQARTGPNGAIELV